MTPDLAATFLFVPGDRPERFAKAEAAGPDCVVLDLEDAVGPAAKATARDHVVSFLSGGGRGVVRMNGPATVWFAEDLAALAAAPPAGILLPKTESPAEVARVRAALPATPVLPIVETAEGIAAALDIARAEGVARLVFGTLDFQLDLGIEGAGEELDAFRAMLVLASRRAGIAPPVDGVSLAIDAPDTVEAEARRARRFGFSAKLLIHPRQVEPAARAFRPSAEELDRARRIVAASNAAAGAAIALDGRMIDAPVVEIARRLVLRHDTAR
ncbi:HpcH/HpaI aldolase/citrate lyase family protein [Prosthecomicrobium pneumaticum]|uniref:Citrate lyase subunit beta/citryl-CoA lyase n=1 Tax=Prosthecomicrobium pneumaticum TaxID=81895 RepID=A0A7W9CU21_9HYPH|nr:CoA ester lyase [Prosthecomicrobium pneumaticum]MBB5751905.1 citrate lyase subunit beta/citryl-CoA lyase [Prosthecomicrobium pneumaticum]